MPGGGGKAGAFKGSYERFGGTAGIPNRILAMTGRVR